ncbi:hypothetical protein ABS767_12215 [Sphingomonas sp. ST-64]|uniref:NACHT domain-containing protein n=1 Tax=Sphingomonas plantiphila TaxID=3163295 RepID=A0ABW8YN74_9SPHN
MTDQYIDLGRTFRELSLKDTDDDEFDYRLLRYGKGLNWSDLQSRHRTVILSEAGAGKTEEIRHAAQTLRGEGKQAFFLRLEHVADDFDIAFEEGTLAEFGQWLSGDESGWLFLDSVDEARLREPKDFERAIRKIGTRLGAALQRTHIVLTSRGSAWRPITDRRLCEQHLKFIPPTPEQSDGEVKEGGNQNAKSSFLFVALDDLNQTHVELFAKARGISNPKPFVDAIERADAWPMAARPDDLAELIDYWNRHGRIGNRLELMQSSISRRLAERDQNRAEALPLAVSEAMAGARSVAAAATMAQESTIRVPDGVENTKGLVISHVLPGWDDKKCAALLARPIFDEAIYRTVRFHHRTVREYLTAEWFKGLLDRETSRRKIESLFFREQYGLEVITPAMRPVLVWLILLDDQIRERALAISPELIFEGGEPKALPPSTRQAIVRDVCEEMKTGVLRSSTTDYRAIQRFADKDIAADVKSLFAEYEGKPEIQNFLLRMVWHGELRDALPEAMAVALDPKANHYSRISAFRAVRAVGADADRKRVRDQFLAEAATLKREWFAELLDELPDSDEAVAWVLACLAKLKSKDAHTVDRLPDALDVFAASLDIDRAVRLLDGLHTLLGKRPVLERRFCEISKRHGWLIESAIRITERLLKERHSAALQTACLSTLQRLPSVQHYGDWNLRGIKSDLPGLVGQWIELNDALFWHDVGQARRFREKKKRERITAVWQVSIFGSYWQFTPEAFDRVLEYVSTRTVKDDRLVALSLAFKLYVQAGRPRKWRDAMKSAAETPALRAALKNHLRPPPMSAEMRRWKKQNVKWARSAKRREAADTENERKWKEYLADNVALLRDPGLPDKTAITDAQYYVHEKMRALDENNAHWSHGNWRVLTAEFSPEIAEAFRDGVVAYWRRYKPRLRSEGKADNSTPFRVIFGLTGLNIEWRESENWAASLTEHEAEIAFRYAMDELNGFPAWLPSLFERFPKLISDLLLVEVDRDLRVEQAKRDTNYILSDLSHSGMWAWEEVSAGLLARLKAREPKNLTNLGHILTVIAGAGVAEGEIAKLAEERSRDRRLAHAARWFAVWTSLEPDKAIPALTARLKTVKVPASQTRLVMQFITYLVGSRRNPIKIGEAFRTPKHLKDLYALTHLYVREKDDIHRAGKGVYSPGLRDNAQDARNQLFSLLKEIPGKEAYLALVDLAQFHPEPSSRPWMQHHAKTKAELDADLTPWTVQQTLDFQTVIERTPGNHRELFELAQMRLLDLKDNLEHGDSSIADILIKGATKETDMRKYIGDWLRDRAQGRYHIPQEEELADDKRMDLRFHGMGFDAPVPAELKLADNWTGPELFERLENQLCGDYLRDPRSNRGLFALVYRGTKQHWELPDSNEQVDFSGLVRALELHWQAISARYPNIDDVRVVGIDLTRRRKGSV